VGGGRQAPTGAVLRVLAPLDGSGCDHGACEPLARPVVFRGAPALRGLVPCRSRPWSCPSELSPLEEPYPLSRAAASVWVRVRPPPGATSRELFRCFPRRADPLPRFARRLPGRMGWDDGSSRPLKEDALPRAPLLQLVGLAGKRPARPLRSFALLGSPFSRRSPPWPG